MLAVKIYASALIGGTAGLLSYGYNRAGERGLLYNSWGFFTPAKTGAIAAAVIATSAVLATRTPTAAFRVTLIGNILLSIYASRKMDHQILQLKDNRKETNQR